jgi:fibronectin type 3 domain-containing protein
MVYSIDLNWNAPTTSTDPVAGYNIYRSTNGGATFTKLNGSVDTVLDYTDSNVQSGTTYTYVVKGVDASGQESGPSNQISLPVP